MKRLLELFEGPEAPGPWSPPDMPAALHALLPWRAFDESSETYVNAASAGFVIELPPFAGIDTETLGALAGTLADAAAERCTIQVIHWASPRFGAASRAWAEPRGDAGGALARMGTGRRDLLASGGWRRLHAGGPPFTLSDYRVSTGSKELGHSTSSPPKSAGRSCPHVERVVARRWSPGYPAVHAGCLRSNFEEVEALFGQLRDSALRRR